jgi:hypothetical protein
MKVFFLKSFFLSFLVLACYSLFAQSAPVTIIEYPAVWELYSEIPEEVNETSGLILFEEDIWTHNDSGGKPEFYRISKETGKVTQRIVIESGQNVDWEDIGQDESFIYAGDFGNNKGNRRDLKIYKVKKSDISDAKKVNVRAEEILFFYTDQTSFDGDERNHNFDCEALISYGDSLVVFTKNWNDGRTRMYKLPKTPGEFHLSPIADFNADGLITGADYDESTGNLVLLGYQDRIPFVYVFAGFTGNSFVSPAIHRINFPRMQGYQTEGIGWLEPGKVIISNESRKEIEQAVHFVDLKKIIEMAPPARN